jgi:hypothetical protein
MVIGTNSSQILTHFFIFLSSSLYIYLASFLGSAPCGEWHGPFELTCHGASFLTVIYHSFSTLEAISAMDALTLRCPWSITAGSLPSPYYNRFTCVLFKACCHRPSGQFPESFFLAMVSDLPKPGISNITESRRGEEKKLNGRPATANR